MTTVSTPGTPGSVGFGITDASAFPDRQFASSVADPGRQKPCGRARSANAQLARAALLLLLLIASAPCRGHDIQTPRPSSAELAKVTPAIRGSQEFAAEALAHLRTGIPEAQAQVLDRMAGSMASAQAIRAGQVVGLGAPEADYYRWRAEQDLTAFCRDFPGAVSLDFTRGSALSLGPIELDQQARTLLLRVDLPGQGLEYAVHECSLVSERDPAPYTVEVGVGGRTVVLLKMDDVPAGEAGIVFRFRRRGDGAPAYFAALRLRSRPVGQLHLSVLDEGGRPVPALVRLTARPSGRLLAPAGAVDLTAMMNDVTGLPIYGPGRGYQVWLPLRWQGRYWIVPRPFEMAAPAGEWDVHVLRGIEYVPVRTVVRVPEGGRGECVIRLRRAANMQRLGWYSGDDHVHSRLMSSEDADRLLAAAEAADVQIVNVLEMGDERRTWYAQRGFGPDFRAQRGDTWLVPGQEDPRSALGHAIGLNLRARVRDLDRYYLNDWIASEIHKQGGLYGHTHVGAGVPELMTEREMAIFTPMGIVDFCSVMQTGLGTSIYFDFLNLGLKMTATAGTDTPYGGTVGAVRTYAYCGRGKFTPDAWFEAVRAGRTFVTNGPTLDFTVNGRRPGAEIPVRQGAQLRVQARATGVPGQWAPVALEIVWLGKVVKRVEAPLPASGELRLDFSVPAGYGGWIAARAFGEDGSQAQTGPITVVRPGFRPWDPTAVSQIVARQLAVLDATEAALRAAEQVAARPEAILDEFNRLQARQAPQIRERLAAARAWYVRARAEAADELRKREASR